MPVGKALEGSWSGLSLERERAGGQVVRNGVDGHSNQVAKAGDVRRRRVRSVTRDMLTWTARHEDIMM